MSAISYSDRSLFHATASVTAGATQAFTATGTYEDGSEADITDSVTWFSSADEVATLAADGMATGAGCGVTAVTALDAAARKLNLGTRDVLKPLVAEVAAETLPRDQHVAQVASPSRIALGTLTDLVQQPRTGVVRRGILVVGRRQGGIGPRVT